jgi:hypothetical protein
MNWKDVAAAQVKALTQNLSEGNEKKCDNPVKIAGLQGNI